jgi:amidase
MDIDFDGALAQAKALDVRFKQTGKVVGPLHGLPISIKVLSSSILPPFLITLTLSQDHIDVVNTKWTLGYVCWRKNVSTSDAVLVQTLRKAGAVIYVKTTMPQTGMVRTTSHLGSLTDALTIPRCSRLLPIYGAAHSTPSTRS